MYRFILISFIVLLSACQQNPPKPDIDAPPAITEAAKLHLIGKIIWAEDDAAIAFHLQEAEGYQLYIEGMEDEGKRQALGKPSPHKPLAWYFMRKQGYVLRKSQDDKGRFYFDRIDLQGNEITVLELQPTVLNCPQPVLEPNILPSSNGRYLAFSYYSDCDTLQLDFLRARSLASTANYSLNVQASSLHWQEKDLIITDAEEQMAWRAQRRVAPEAVAYPSCVLPETSSSYQSSQGEIAILDATGALSFSSAEPWCEQAE